MLIPPINTSGTFKFATPFDTVIKSNQELTVKSVRTISELNDSNSEPFKMIYQVAGLTESDYKSDLDNNVPIITFTDSACNYLYIPASKILSLPKLDGVKYQEKALVISLGNIPLNMNLDLVKSNIADIIYDTTGVRSTIEAIPTSAINLVSNSDNDTYMAKLDNAKQIVKSFRTKYLEATTVITEKNQLLTNMENVIKNKVCNV